MLELIAVMELGVVWGSIDPHFVDDFEPAVTEPAQGISMALVLLAMMLIVSVGLRRNGTDFAQKKDGWRDGGVCHRPSADERASIDVVFLNA